MWYFLYIIFDCKTVWNKQTDMYLPTLNDFYYYYKSRLLEKKEWKKDDVDEGEE